MARIRTVKPELFRHEGLFEAEEASGLPLRVAFIGLFTVCDRRGVFRWQPRQIKLDVMPYDSVDFSRVLDALASRGFVKKYAFDGDEFGIIPSFVRHQVINNKEKPSHHPSIEDADSVFSYETMTNSTRAERVQVANETPLEPDQGEGKGKEGKGKEQEGNGKGKGNRKERVNESVEAMIEILPGLSEETADEYLAFRKAKKAPLTPGAWKKIASEIQKSGLRPDDALNTAMARGWQGFDASWLSQSGGMGGKPFNKQAAIEENNMRVVQEIMDRETARGMGSQPPNLFDLGDPITVEGEYVHAE